MTATATLRPAARRLVRSVVGWRALRVALFLSGLLALGLIGAAQAQASELAPDAPDAPGESRLLEAESAAEAEAATPAEALTDATEETEALDSIRETAQRSTDGAAAAVSDAAQVPDVASDVADVASDVVSDVVSDAAPIDRGAEVARVVEGAGAAGGERLGGVVGAVGAPVRDRLSESVQAVGDGLRSVSETVRQPVDRRVGRLVGEAVRPGADGDPVAAERGQVKRGGVDAATDAADLSAAASSPVVEPTATYRPLDTRGLDGGSVMSRGHAVVDGIVAVPPHASLPIRIPLPRPLVPQPFGVGAHAVVDSGTQRHHGEPLAATLSGGASVQLVPGPGAPETYSPVRDRHRDILEFPG
ncbi:hypothetical protein [Streptomyces apocyni]|uniref:hypothetical protein n=1 Tax=Streptomyces apocyni TaxID=2654677 RepID=UPI0012EA92B3|nr:hypothetical protein [Streptomyces apocyni]